MTRGTLFLSLALALTAQACGGTEADVSPRAGSDDDALAGQPAADVADSFAVTNVPYVALSS